jgi:carboxylesterase type B
MPGSYWKALLVVSLSSVAVSQPVDIKTSIGTFRGFTNGTSGLELWRGVPFARPPVGNLRFRAPVPITEPFHGIQNATRFGPACPQPVSFTVYYRTELHSVCADFP